MADLPVMVGVAVICLPVIFNGMNVFRWERGLLLSYFVLYTTYILLRAVEHDALHGLVTIVAWGVLPITGLTLVPVPRYPTPTRPPAPRSMRAFVPTAPMPGG